MTVALVGAGPGDPGLITVRGLELVRSCDVLVADRLVHPELVAKAPADALVIHRAPLDQNAINQLLVDLGRHQLVVRLKGGDPFVFGRGGEEAIALARAGIPYEIVPGVSSIAAVPAAAGIPITHRGISDTVTVTTGHTADNTEPNYEALAAAGGTIVLFMAATRIYRAANGLIAAGLDPSTPTAAISRGTLAEQRTIRGSLEQIRRLKKGLSPPALLVVGGVVSLADEIGGLAPSLSSSTGPSGEAR